MAHLRVHPEETILAVHNLADRPQVAHLDLAAFAGVRPLDLFSGEVLPAVTDVPYRLELPRYGYRWLRLR